MSEQNSNSRSNSLLTKFTGLMLAALSAIGPFVVGFVGGTILLAPVVTMLMPSGQPATVAVVVAGTASFVVMTGAYPAMWFYEERSS